MLLLFFFHSELLGLDFWNNVLRLEKKILFYIARRKERIDVALKNMDIYVAYFCDLGCCLGFGVNYSNLQYSITRLGCS